MDSFKLNVKDNYGKMRTIILNITNEITLHKHQDIRVDWIFDLKIDNTWRSRSESLSNKIKELRRQLEEL